MMNPLLEAASEVGRFFEDHGWPYCVIGGLAVQNWGEPRTTLDADINLFTGLGGEETFVDVILEKFESRITGAREFALTRRVLLIRASNGKDVDISMGGLPFEAEMIERAVTVELCQGIRLPCCTAEDLVILKAFADRPRDWLDIQGIVTRQSRLDNQYVLAHLAMLCELKEAPEILEKTRRLLAEKP